MSALRNFFESLRATQLIRRNALLSRFFLALVLLLGLSIQAASAQTFVSIPALSGHVVDQIKLLTAQQHATLEATLAQYEQRTGSQIAVLLMASTAPEAIEQYSIRVADAWRVGRKGIDDGIILVVAKDNPHALRRLRIEAGRGVQGTVTDIQSKHILQDVIAPHFEQNDFYGGLTAGLSALTTLLDQEHLAAPAAQTHQNNGDSALESLLPLLFFAFLIFISIVSRSGGGRNGLNHNGWGTAAGVILGTMLNSRGGGGGFGGGGGGGFTGGGGGFDGGGASGDW